MRKVRKYKRQDNVTIMGFKCPSWLCWYVLVPSAVITLLYLFVPSVKMWIDEKRSEVTFWTKEQWQKLMSWLEGASNKVEDYAEEQQDSGGLWEGIKETADDAVEIFNDTFNGKKKH